MSTSAKMPLSLEQCITLACLLEATAPKPGNVHRSADFDDLCFNDFVCSAVAVGPALASAQDLGVGAAVLQAVQATRVLVETNTNLGYALLIAPLAAVPSDLSLSTGISTVLDSLTPRDAEQVYEAIRLASPGGIGTVGEMDIADSSPQSIVDAMQLAAERDLVARQYTNGFHEVLGFVVPALVGGQSRGWSLTTTVINTHVRLMSEFPDSLIARKCGTHVALEAADRAKSVLVCGEPQDNAYQRALGDLDFWLRSDGHRRNPGTTADLIAAGLFAGLRDQQLVTPYR